jgi:hypothetical protein
MVSRYAETYAAWQRDPLNFWAEAAKEIDWIQAPQDIFDAKAGVYGRWFPDATCNTCWNALDRHVMAGQGARIALSYDSPLAGVRHTRIPRLTCNRIIFPFSCREPDRVDRRKVDDIESHGLCIFDARYAIPKFRSRICFTPQFQKKSGLE